MNRTRFQVALLDAYRALGGSKVVPLGCGTNFPIEEMELAILSAHFWLQERLLELFADDEELSSALGGLYDSFNSRLFRFCELANIRNMSEINTLSRDELIEAGNILVSLHNDYYKHIPDYKTLTDTVFQTTNNAV